MRFVRYWHRLPREAMAAPSLEVLMVKLDGALSSLVCGAQLDYCFELCRL